MEEQTVNPSTDIIAQKATMVQKESGLSQKAVNFGSILTFITQLFQGLSKCPATSGTPAAVHGAISNPTRQQTRVAERLARQNFRRDPVAQESVLHGMYAVGKTTTEPEAVAMYTVANGRAPGE